MGRALTVCGGLTVRHWISVLFVDVGSHLTG